MDKTGDNKLGREEIAAGYKDIVGETLSQKDLENIKERRLLSKTQIKFLKIKPEALKEQRITNQTFLSCQERTETTPANEPLP